MDWDACIDIVTAHLEPGAAAPGDAVAKVRAAVERLPGASWVSVAWCGDLPAQRWLRVFRRGSSMPVDGPEWDKVRRDVERAVTLALA
jgi:hypothetical protein